MIPSEPVPGPAYRIVTPRLVFRCLEPKDASIYGGAEKKVWITYFLVWLGQYNGH